MNRCIISIIVPVYNAEKYIRRCVDSIIAQTYHNLNIILVNDGSTDNSGSICEQYAKEDNRIQVIHKQNGGVSSARQKGLEVSQGDYVIHVDPDDWIEPNEIEDLYNKAIADNADMVICDYWYETDKEKHIEKTDLSNTTTSEIRKRILSQQLHGSCWNKLVRKKVIEDSGCGFFPTNISYCEDILFNVRLLMNDIKISYLPKALYHYNMANPSSITLSFSEKKINSWMDVIYELEQFLPEEEIPYLYAQKKDVLYVAFRLREFNLLRNKYKEIHRRMIKEAGNYSWRTPISSNLALALKGHPQIAFLLFHIEMKAIHFLKFIKSWF